MRGRRALASIGGSLPLEVPVGGAALHEVAPRSVYRADDDLTVLQGGFEGRMKLFYKKSDRKRLEVGAVRRVCAELLSLRVKVPLLFSVTGGFGNIGRDVVYSSISKASKNALIEELCLCRHFRAQFVESLVL